ncbi:hypothetical protein GCM10022397_29090 [Flavivirga jejuensis]
MNKKILETDYISKPLLLLFNFSIIICLGQGNTNIILTQTFEQDINKVENIFIQGAKVVGENNKTVFLMT